MIDQIAKHLKGSWRTLALSDILFRLISICVLAPAIGWLFQWFLAVSGRDVLADTDIAKFLLNPIGWAAFLIIGAATLGLFALELAVLVIVCVGIDRERTPRPISAVQFALAHAHPIFRTAASVIIRCLMIATPFLAAGGLAFVLLMTEHDINYYLTERPPAFILAVVLIGACLCVMLALIFKQLIGWIFAIPIVVFEDLKAKQALLESERRAEGHRKAIAGNLGCWAVTIFLIRFAGSFAGIWAAQFIVIRSANSLPILMIAIGVIIMLIASCNLIIGMLANATLASCISILYLRHPDCQLKSAPNWSPTSGNSLITFTRGRIISAVVLLFLASALLGVLSLSQFKDRDKVIVTAHRGGATNAPENTLAAVQRGIQDGADWIEIDVQESIDGVVLVIHDSDLMKVGGKPMKIWETTAAELRSVDIGSFFDKQFSDQRIPTLEEVLETCRGKAGVNIELKYYGHDQDLERKVVEIVERLNMSDQIVIMSLETSGIQKIKQLRPDWTVGLLTAVVAGDLTRAKADFLAVKDSIATDQFVRSAHQQGKSVAAWTLNDADSMSMMISRGVDNLITDRPALARQVIKKREALSPIERLSLELAYYLGVPPDANLLK